MVILNATGGGDKLSEVQVVLLLDTALPCPFATSLSIEAEKVTPVYAIQYKSLPPLRRF